MAKKGKTAGGKEGSGLAGMIQEAQAKQIDKQQQKPAPKPKTKAEKRQDRIDGIKKTVYPGFLGVLAGFACFYSSENIQFLPWHFVMVVLILVTYFIQKVTYPLLKVDVTGFKNKDWFYVEFMVVDLWLVTWTVLLN